MEKTYHFAIDLGATSGRTILATFDGEKVEMQEISRFKNPMIPISGPSVLESTGHIPRNFTRIEKMQGYT